MVFKLVRTDTQEPAKIQLSVGTHIIGRGKFLHNDDTDKRVSRNHAQLEVTSDTINLKSLHQNPCFYMKKSIEVQLLNQDNSISLCHGDKFGLLPEHFWYEVLHCPGPDITVENPIPQSVDNGVHEDNDRNGSKEEVRDDDATPDLNSDDGINFDDNEEVANAVGSASQSLLPADQDTEPVTADQVNAEQIPTAQETTEKLPTQQENGEVTVKQEDTEEYEPPQVPTTDGTRSPAKRNHSSTESSPVDVKKVKTEPEDRVDAAAGPSNGQQASSDKKDNIGAPASPPTPARPQRERCIYGANCYRRNPQHKSQFSHPADPDWGCGPRGTCPYGARCRRLEPRHWALHDHPPGTQPPALHAHRPGNRQRRRQRKVSVSDEDDDDTPASNLIVTGKRARKTVHRQDWSGSESERDADPYGTDESDEWHPPSDATASQDTQSQDY